MTETNTVESGKMIKTQVFLKYYDAPRIQLGYLVKKIMFVLLARVEFLLLLSSLIIRFSKETGRNKKKKKIGRTGWLV